MIIQRKKYVLLGEPVALSRVRMGNRRVYDGQKNVKAACAIQLSNQHQNLPMFSGPCHLDVTFYLPIARTRKNLSLEGKPHYYKPDLSNLIKFVEDVGTGVIYSDDSIISKISSAKVYDENPRTEFTLSTIEEVN